MVDGVAAIGTGAATPVATPIRGSTTTTASTNSALDETAAAREYAARSQATAAIYQAINGLPDPSLLAQAERGVLSAASAATTAAARFTAGSSSINIGVNAAPATGSTSLTDLAAPDGTRLAAGNQLSATVGGATYVFAVGGGASTATGGPANGGGSTVQDLSNWIANLDNTGNTTASIANGAFQVTAEPGANGIIFGAGTVASAFGLTVNGGSTYPTATISGTSAYYPILGGVVSGGLASGSTAATASTPLTALAGSTPSAGDQLSASVGGATYVFTVSNGSFVNAGQFAANGTGNTVQDLVNWIGNLDSSGNTTASFVNGAFQVSGLPGANAISFDSGTLATALGLGGASTAPVTDANGITSSYPVLGAGLITNNSG